MRLLGILDRDHRRETAGSQIDLIFACECFELRFLEQLRSEIELDDGQVVNAMILQADRITKGDKIVDIAEVGGFRAYQAFVSANAKLGEVLGRPDLAG